MDGVGPFAANETAEAKVRLPGRFCGKLVKHGDIPAEPNLPASRKRRSEFLSRGRAAGLVVGKMVEKHT